MKSNRLVRRVVLTVVAAVSLAIVLVPAMAQKPAAKPGEKPGTKPGTKALLKRPLAGQARRMLAAAGQNETPVIKANKIVETIAASPKAHSTVDHLAIAAKVDELIAAELKKTGSPVAPQCSDEDFLRRVSFDIAGVSPSPQDVTLFALDPDSHKRARMIDRLVASTEYAENWARYWRDVIFSRATEIRAPIARTTFETWIKDQLAAKKSWAEITTAMLTALGDVSEDGATALIFIQQGDPKEVASETARVFLGIQLQCANCHDHPSDSWKRDQFHALAAFFPRTQSLPKRDSMGRAYEITSLNPPPGGFAARGPMALQPEMMMRRLDTNRDGKISKEEGKQGMDGGRFFERLLENGDTNKDGALSLEELKKMPPPPQMLRGRGSAEYYMPDLEHPQAQGKKLNPTFFLGNLTPGEGLGDLERRQSLARYITSTDNSWFAKAFVNRIWGQMLGEGFYMPIDDMGPERTATYPAALDALSSGFAASGYDIAWLFRAIGNSETYQRQIRPRDPAAPAPAFASAAPIRLRADQLYSSITRVLGIQENDGAGGPQNMGGPYRGDRSARGQFHTKFGFDPSTTPDELMGTIPQALYMMNSNLVNGLIRAGGQTRLSQILQKYKDDDDALSELFLVVHAREPSAKEAQVCREYIKQVDNRQEAFEDILWSLLNSTEFQTKR